MLAVWKREFKAYFQSVTGWLFVAVLLALYGLYFYVCNLEQGYPYIYYSLSSITIIFLIAVPILTMRCFAEEKKNRTDQMILTSPVSLGKIVIGKYLALISVFSIDIGIFCLTPLLLRTFGTVPMGESYLAILAFWLYGCTCIAVGMFVSALTESQVIAAVITFLVLFAGYMMKGICTVISESGNVLTKILGCLDLYSPFEKFAGGCLDLTSVIYYLSVMILLNFLTAQALLKRRWNISRKKLKFGVFSITTIIAVFAVVVAANLGINALPVQKTAIDCSYSGLYAISKTTKDTLNNLKSDVTVYVLVQEKNKDMQVDEVLKRYKDLSGHFKVKYINPKKHPYFYQDYTDTEPSQNSLIVSGKQRSKVIDYYDLYHYETGTDRMSYAYGGELVGFDAEGQLTSAISYVTMAADKLPVVYAVTGHQEQSLGSDFQNVIKKANMTLSTIELLNENEVPKDAAAIIINAPQVDFNREDAKKVLDYLKNGGRAVLVGSYTKEPLENFDSILKEYKTGYSNTLIAENDTAYYYNMGGPFYLLPKVNESSYTTGIGQNYVYVPATVGITYPEKDNEIQYTSLMDTTKKAVAKTDPDHMESYTYEKGDVKGPFSIGLAVEKKLDDEHAVKLAVFGSPYLFSDEAGQMTANNVELFSDIIHSLIPQEKSDTPVIPEKKCTLSNLTISAGNTIIYGLLLMIVVPVMLLAAGIAVFVIRRKK